MELKNINVENNTTLKEYMIKEIEIIQSIIRRMANNSFLIKGWALSLTVITLILKGNERYKILISFFPLIVFWILDAYFLRQELLYRKLYNWVITYRLKTDEYLFNMDASRFKNEVHSLLRTMFSFTLGLFYISIMILILIYLFFVISRN